MYRTVSANKTKQGDDCLGTGEERKQLLPTGRTVPSGIAVVSNNLLVIMC